MQLFHAALIFQDEIVSLTPILILWQTIVFLAFQALVYDENFLKK